MTDATTRLDRATFARTFATLAKELPKASDTSADLDLFRARVMRRPEDLRRRLLGANVQRRRDLTPAARKALEALDVHPDLLSPLGELRYEPAHSRLVARFIDPHDDPKLPAALLRALLGLVLEENQLPSEEEARGAVVVAERFLPSKRRVDVSVELGGRLVFIEMKVDADEGREQLKDYAADLKQLRGEREGTLIYLTLLEDAEDDVPTHHGALPVSLQQLLAAWLPYAGPGSGPEQYLARYLKSVALLVRCAGQGGFDRWTMTQQRSALDLIEPIE